MTDSAAIRASFSAPMPDAGHIQSILTSNNLTLRDARMRARDMMSAVQPLSIDGKEIFTDTVVAEFVRYATADRMNHQTGTLTLKKSVFGEFEASMTPIPKYCFRNIDDLTAVLVHSVPRFTLEDILDKSEEEFPSFYTWENARLYNDWAKSIIDRIAHHLLSGKRRLFTTIMALPMCLLPPPPHIARKERNRFAAHILRIVACHHRAGIYHDRISGRTIFFPTPCQPLVLSNYSGVPASLLGDLIPNELMDDDATQKYGPQCRDLYSMALLCYRIMTGEQLDGTKFRLESPRPLRMVLGDIACNARLTFSHKNPADIAHTFTALYKATKAIIRLLPSLFSGTTFTAWRKINRATGGVWRTIPVVGPFCDIFQPTQCASALRYILDRYWFMQFASRKNPPGRASGARGPEISLLTGVFRERASRGYPHFESALNVLVSDAGFKRMAFGSLMESEHATETAGTFILTKRKVLTGTATAAVIAGLLLLTMFRHPSGPESAPERSPVTANISGQPTSSATAHSVNTSGPIPVAIPADSSTTAMQVAERPIDREIARPIQSTELTADSVGARRTPIPADASKKTVAAAATDTARTAKVSVRAKNGTRKSASSPAEKRVAAPCGMLSPALGFRSVFIVIGATDSCNPGRLKYPPGDTTGRTTLISRPQRLFMVHRSSSGFGSIETIALCRTDGCDRTLYYTPGAVTGPGRLAFVKTGDALSSDKDDLQRFIKARLALHKK